ncbi:WD40-repeat-containing domain protein [Gamsiella multidivaricata]|uniref:WD40-repeat-containing domain protein n=1 Tax=Gamsiella multidivaricata TaxID=101098 RepID=UPI00221EA403|nr:WD40-repeat-containing domain protein [Gamsiella multidivaricata]KAG0371207.1 WD repeat-containing protein 74 [Gamsiella multidivaricata]KAI7827970.1 WD40-repeat-containing domain protein [Gamsiella multidivaricata]
MSSRRFYTGDEQGLIKVVTITEAPVVKVKRLRRNQPTPEPPAKPVPTVEAWGTPDRERAIQLLCWDHEKKYLVAARKNGLVQLIDPKSSGAVIAEFKQQLVKEGKADTIFVGLFANSESLITCTNTGILTIQSIQNPSQTKHLNVGKGICRMRVHPKEHHIIATGGNEQELTIWDLNEFSKEFSKDLQGPVINGKKAGKDGKVPASTASAGTAIEKQSESRYKSKEILAGGQIFRSKNVKNDHLDLRVPVWNTDLQFLSHSDISRIAVGTRHHQIRVYDTKSGARRPVVDKEVGEMPVVALSNGQDASEIVFSDTVTNVYSIDTLTGSILGQYKGFTGVATALATFRPFEGGSTPHLVSVAMDRCLRVHEMNKSRKLLHKVYLKQRMTAVVVGEYTPAEHAEDDEEGANPAKSKKAGKEEDDKGDDDELWESMGKLQDKKSKKRKAAK